MKINLDDPKLTAYALDELPKEEKAEMENAVAASPEAQAFVTDLREIAGALKSEYEAERVAHPVRHTNIIPLAEKDDPWSMSRRLALAAAIAFFAVIGALAVGTMWRGASRQNVASSRAAQPSIFAEVDTETPIPPPPPKAAPLAAGGQVAQAPAASNFAAPAMVRAKQSQAFMASEMKLAETPQRQDFNTAGYGHFEENPFLAAATNPLSTFSIDVDTASYSNVRRFLTTARFRRRTRCGSRR